MTPSTSHDKDGKASFDDVYDAPDPRPYFRTLGRYDYGIGAAARDVFRHLLEIRRRATSATPTMVDLCCSYGINAALVNHHVESSELFERYSDPALDDLTTEELAKADTGWYAERRREDAVWMVGFDIATRAVHYANEIGLLDAGSDRNLEEHPLDATFAAHAASADLVTITGGLGYIGTATLGQILGAADPGSRPWFAGFALRWMEPTAVTRTMAGCGLVLERYGAATFPQRRFTDPEERAYCLDELQKLGRDPALEADTDSFHAELWIGRPRDQTGDDLADLLAGVV